MFRDFGTGKNPAHEDNLWLALIGSIVAILILGPAYVVVQAIWFDEPQGPAAPARGSSYEQSCEEWNQRNPDMYTDPEQCAADAEQLERETVEYLSK